MKAHAWVASMLGLALLAAGCDSSNIGQESLVAPGDSVPRTGSLTVQMASPPAFQNVILRYAVNALDGEGAPLVGELDQESSAASVQAQFSRVPVGPVRIVVRVETLDGEVVATEEENVFIRADQAEQLAVSQYFQPGQTRQIGLVSVGSNGTQAAGASVSPVLNGDGRFVAFASRANLVSGGTPGQQEILFRDRSLGTLSRVSLNATGNPVNLDCFEPDMDSSGNSIVFRAGSVNNQGSLFVRQRSRGTRPPATVFLQPGRKPRISANGDFVVFEFLDSNLANRSTIVLKSVDGATTELVSRSTAAGSAANGDSIKPCLSGTGQFVVFASQATNLIAGGTPGLYLLDRATGVLQRLPIAANLTDTSITPDGKFILASAPGAVPVLFDRELNTSLALSAITGLVGRPSMSKDGNLICFFSSSSTLINNDLNNKTDCFVLNRARGSLDRVNAANDGTAVAGGVDDQTPLTGPSLSADGKRIAFSSRDNRLVPNNSNLNFDIYSCAVPTAGLLYVVNSDTIRRFESVTTATGVVQPVLEGFSGAVHGASSCFLDANNDRLYIANSGANGGIVVFNNASRLTGTNLAPNRRISGPGLNGLDQILVDTTRNILYGCDGVRIIALANASTVDGDVPLNLQRRFQFAEFGHTRMTLDSRRDELYVSSSDPNTFGNFVGVVKASTASGAPTILRALSGANAQLDVNIPLALALDTSPGATTATSFNDARLVVSLTGGGTSQLSTFNSNGSFTGFLGNVAPNAVTPLGAPGGSRNLLIDPYTNLRYLDGVPGTFRVFRANATTATPDRQLTFSFPPNTLFGLQFSIDRTR